MKIYVTFGQAHTHRINNKTFDCDCVAVLEDESPTKGREKVFETFGTKFCFEYPEQFFDHSTMKHFPRGFINVD